MRTGERLGMTMGEGAPQDDMGGRVLVRIGEEGTPQNGVNNMSFRTPLLSFRTPLLSFRTPLLSFRTPLLSFRTE